MAWLQLFLRRVFAIFALASIAILTIGTATAADDEAPLETGLYLVQSSELAIARELVQSVGGRIDRELPIINAVGAMLTVEQLAALKAAADVRVYENTEVALDGRRKKRKRAEDSTRTTSDTSLYSSGTLGYFVEASGEESLPTDTSDDTANAVEPVDSNIEESDAATEADSDATTELDADYIRPTEANGWLEWSELSRTMERVDYEHPLTISAPDVHALGIIGKGVTVAVIDTGLWWEADTLLSKSPKVFIDVTGQELKDDPNGHGTHVASIIGSDRLAKNGVFEGIAPGSQLAILRAFRADGSATYLDVIHAIDVAVAEKDEHNIRVLNLSFSAAPQSHYWDDPLNQAVMAAWQAGIVVIASAGNDGPDPMTIGVPGNVPYIITVGAMTDNFTPFEPLDDRLASFSSAGPTYEGFVKPDVIAPGGHIVSSMPFDSVISLTHPESMMDTQRNFAMSGTSQATAIVSGVVALMLQNDPTLTPDEVKCRLMASTRPAVNHDGELAYTVFQQGAGLINALEAVNSSATQCANLGLNVAQDLSGEQHFGGRANRNEDGEYYLSDESGERLEGDGFLWSRAYMWSQGYLWSRAYMWSQGFVWSRGFLWSQNYMWSRSVPWDEGAIHSSGLTETMKINKWVDHE